jgi:sarcosine oxidase subunit beta
VLAVLAEGDRITGVRTSRGLIHAPRVVNVAGLWGARLGAMVGLDIPITVCRHKISIVTWPEAARGRTRRSMTSSPNLHAAGDGRVSHRFPDLAAFRLLRFAEGTQIRGTYGDWLMG